MVTDAQLGQPAAHGRDKIVAILSARSIPHETVATLDQARGKTLVVVGRVTGEGPAARLLSQGQAPVVQGPEALIIRRMLWHGKTAWVLGGSDDRGLMYAELDVANRIGWGTDPVTPLAAVREAVEHPDVSERALSVYTMNRGLLGEPLLRRDLLGALPRPAGAEPFQLAGRHLRLREWRLPGAAYPYFFDVDGLPRGPHGGPHPRAATRNLPGAQPADPQSHDRGLKVTVGIWDHIYRGGVQGGGVPGA